MQKYAIVAIHDVCPKNFTKVKKIRELLLKENIEDFSYLVIPRFHNKESEDLRNNEQFVNFLKRDKHEIVIHGLTHFNLFLDDEFAGINYIKAIQKLRDAKKIFKKVGFKPKGFIPPMWLMSRATLGAAIDEGFEYVANQKFLYNLRIGEKYRLMLIVRGGILFVPSVLNSTIKARKFPLLQFALHPKDNSFKLSILKRIINLAKKREYKFVSYQTFLNEVS